VSQWNRGCHWDAGVSAQMDDPHRCASDSTGVRATRRCDSASDAQACERRTSIRILIEVQDIPEQFQALEIAKHN
jgi:hypothetical protein